MASSPGSSDLSDLPSEDFDDGESTVDVSSRQSIERGIADGDAFAPPAKRRKTGNGAARLWPYERATSSQPPDDADELLSVSEDSYGSAPGSPAHDEWTVRGEAQVECLWRDCDFGRAQNNDELVQHVQSTHCATGGPKRTKYVCEWGECQKKTSNHPSGYALKAHMRSHTKEKPYYCALPECDKAFTRSDALAKHMRTVHEPEQTRGPGLPSTSTLEPPTMAKKPAKLKLGNGAQPQTRYTGDPKSYFPEKDKFGQEIDPSPANDNITYIPAHHPVTGQPGFMIHYPPDIHFSTWESTISATQLVRVLRRQINWAHKEAEELERTNEELEAARRNEWKQKEALLQVFIDLEQEQLPRYRRTKASAPELPPFLEATDDRTDAILPRRKKPGPARRSKAKDTVKEEPDESALATAVPELDEVEVDAEPGTSPPPIDTEGGFDGDDDPYDNYLQELLKRYKARDLAAAEAEKAERQDGTELTAA